MATALVPGSSFTPEQLEQRRRTLGASEIAAVAGLNPHQSALDVWLVKTGRVAPFQGNSFTEWGLRVERILIEKYAEVHSVGLERPGTLIHSQNTWMSATPDALVLGDIGEPAMARWGLETKNRSARQVVRWGESGTDQIPHDVAAQVYWSMMVTGLSRWDVAVLFGGNEYREYRLHFDEEIAAVLLEQGERFWYQHVVADREPPLGGGEAAHRYLAEKFRSHTEVMREATADLERVARDLRRIREQKKALEAEESALEAAIKQVIGDAAGVQGRGFKATWKAAKSGPVAWKSVVDTIRERVMDLFRGEHTRLEAQRVDAIIAEAVAQHTAPGSRRFLVSFPKDE